MSQQGSEERTEDASPSKLKKARERGEIASSQTFVSVCSTIGGAAATWAYFGAHGDRLARLNRDLLAADDLAMAELIRVLRATLVELAMPAVFGAAVLGLLASFIANRGLIFSPGKITPSFSHIGWSSYASKTFSRASLVNLLQIMLFMMLIFALLYGLHRYFEDDYFEVFFCGVDCGVDFLATVEQLYIAIALLIALGIGLLDLKLQSVLYLGNQRSTKTEMKQEMKDEMGEPHIRKERKGQHQRMLSAATLEETMQGSTLILHFADETAVAIRYVNAGGQEAYYVVEGGIARSAEKLIAGARAYNKPLAQASRGLATTLARYENERQIHDVALIAELRRLIARLTGGG